MQKKSCQFLNIVWIDPLLGASTTRTAESVLILSLVREEGPDLFMY